MYVCINAMLLRVLCVVLLYIGRDRGICGVTAWMPLSDGKRLLLLDALTLKVIRPGQIEHILLTL